MKDETGAGASGTPGAGGDLGADDNWLDWAIEWCWLTTPSGTRLHHGSFRSGCADPFGPGRTDCGIETELSVPGIFTRMTAQRCRRCCAATGMPQGAGSPKNDDTCREVLDRSVDRPVTRRP